MITRINILKCSDFYVKWYYNGYHYWSFISGVENFTTSGEHYRTEGRRTISISSGQINFEQCEAIKTILLSNEISVYLSGLWYGLRVDPTSVEIYNSTINGYEINLQVFLVRSIAPYVEYEPPVVSPLFVSAYTVIGNDDQVRVNFDRNLNPLLIPLTTDFTLAGKTITDVSIIDNYVILEVSVPYEFGDVITVVYTKPLTNPLTAKIGGGEVASFSESVTNNVGDVLLIGVEDFVTDNYADYFASAAVLSSLVYDLIWEAATAGIPFTGSPSIADETGDVAGVFTPANQVASQEGGYERMDVEVDSVTSGTADVTCRGVTKELAWDSDVETSLYNFVFNYDADYAAIDITLSYEMLSADLGRLHFDETVTGLALNVSDMDITNTSGDMNGIVIPVTPVSAVKQKVVLSVSGTSGTALITVNAVARTITI